MPRYSTLVISCRGSTVDVEVLRIVCKIKFFRGYVELPSCMFVCDHVSLCRVFKPGTFRASAITSCANRLLSSNFVQSLCIRVKVGIMGVRAIYLLGRE